MNLLTKGAAVVGRIAAASVSLGGTLVTATAAEINKLAGVVAGTASASKAAVLGANKNLDILALPVSGLKIGAGAGTAMDCTAAELNTLNGVTAGTAAASKAIVLDTNKAVSGQRAPILTKSANYTVTAADSGSVILVASADKVLTLPATAAGYTYTFVLAFAGLSAGTGLSISPAAADKIMGNGLAGVDNKDLILAGAGDVEGDSVTLVGDGVDGYYIVSVNGIWTIEG